jgi:hypothetical protein
VQCPGDSAFACIVPSITGSLGFAPVNIFSDILYILYIDSRRHEQSMLECSPHRYGLSENHSIMMHHADTKLSKDGTKKL